MYLYEPDKVKNPVYDLPIHSEDDLLNGFTYQQIIDEVVAAKKEINKETIKEQITEHLNMAIEDMWENFELCKNGIVKAARSQRNI